MEYSEKLRERIHKTAGVDPLEHTPDYVRNTLEDLLDEISTMVFGHIGNTRVNEDVTITNAEVNSLARVREVYSEFMEAYEKFFR